MEWLAGNWEWVLVAFYVAEKVVKLTPAKLLGRGIVRLIKRR